LKFHKERKMQSFCLCNFSFYFYHLFLSNYFKL
jgi:hypothetical protein